MKRISAALCGATILAGAAAHAGTTTLDFESGGPAQFSGSGTVTGVGGLGGFNGFSGSFLWNTGTTGVSSVFTFSGLDPHSEITVSFGLALIDSWDGVNGTPAPDYFNLLADGAEIFDISVANTSGTIEDIPAEATGRSSPGNIFGSSYTDTLFNVSLTFAHSASELTLTMFADGTGWQGSSDESWGIDNLTVTTSAPAVPLPAGLPLLLAGLGGMALLRGRRT